MINTCLSWLCQASPVTVKQLRSIHDMTRSRLLDTNSQHFRLALRTLAKTPGFTTTVVLTLALGIGANSAVFSAINAVLLKPLPFPDSDQLILMNQRSPRS